MTAKIALEANPNTQWIAHLLGPADAPPLLTQLSTDPDPDPNDGPNE